MNFTVLDFKWVGSNDPEETWGVATFYCNGKIFLEQRMDTFAEAHKLVNCFEFIFKQGVKNGITTVKSDVVDLLNEIERKY